MEFYTEAFHSDEEAAWCDAETHSHLGHGEALGVVHVAEFFGFEADVTHKKLYGSSRYGLERVETQPRLGKLSGR